jgi:osmotically-inducible protein OsmY
MSKSDIQLKQDIEAELRWDPKVNPARIGVTVDKGTVSLMGAVDTYAEKWAAENAAKRVGGVRAVAADLTVKVPEPHKHTDSEIAAAALSALKLNVWIPQTVTVNVEQGRITLQGEVEWKYQSDSAESAVRYLAGVVSVSNFVSIKPKASAAQVKEKVQAALERQATADARSIQVDTSGGTVTLSGDASNWHAVDDAIHAAWSAPGVTKVVCNVALTVIR